MRAIVLTVLAILATPSMSLCAEKTPYQVLALDIYHPNETVLAQIAERFKVAAEHNSQVLGIQSAPVRHAAETVDDDPVVFVVWVGEDGRAAGLYQILLHEVEDDALQPRGTRLGEKLTSFVLGSSSPDFDLAKKAFEEVMDSTEQTIEMPQTPAVKKLLGAIKSTTSVFAERWPK